MTNEIPTRHRLWRLLLLSTLLLPLLSGCHRYDYVRTTVSYEYDYYPSLGVYYDYRSRVYYYHHVDRGWVRVRRLPPHIVIRNVRPHRIVVHDRRPWRVRHRYWRPHRRWYDKPRHGRHWKRRHDRGYRDHGRGHGRRYRRDEGEYGKRHRRDGERHGRRYRHDDDDDHGRKRRRHHDDEYR